MNEPVSPAAPLRVVPGPEGSIDDDASLTVDQVSEEPPEAASVFAFACRDALAQARPCPLCALPRSPRPLPKPRKLKPSSLGRPASKVARSLPRKGTNTPGIPVAKGEMVSLQGDAVAELLVASCKERGPRLALTGKVPESLDEEVEELLELEPDPPPTPPPVPPSRKPSTPTPPPAPVERAAPRPAVLPTSTASTQAATIRTPTPAPIERPVVEVAQPKPIALISDFDDPPALDPRQAFGIPIKPPPPRPARRLHPKAVALFGGLFGLAVLGTVLTFAIRFGPAPTPATSASAGSGRGGPPPSATPSASASATPEAPSDPGPWRVSALASEEGVKMISGKLGTRSLLVALEDEHVPRPQIFRILKAFEDPKLFDKPRKNHQYVVALDRASKRVRAFEYQASATEVWQAREVEEGKLSGSKLDLKIEQRKVSKGLVIDGSLRASLVDAGLDDDMVALLDDVLSDRVSLERLGKGTGLRLVAQEQIVAGRFSKYLSLDAIEYRLPRSDKPVRLYNFRNGKIAGVFDAAGKAPYRTSWGPPLKIVRVTSKFNPKRLHPVLHTVMPHNGTDFGAPMGTPVYAVAAGTVSHVGPQGPSGNLVLVEHANALESGYAHLSRFAANLKKGDKVEAQQLVGYVGSTGRSTGPHLHFSIRRAGAFVDPLTVIKLNQERVLPKADREAFDAYRAEMDKLLDAIPMADAPAEGAGAPEEGEHGDENNHGDEHDPGAASGAPSASAAPDSSRPEPPAAPPVTDDTSPDSAVWRPD